MALPTVEFDQVAAGTGSSLVSNFMTRLQARMFAVGWTIMYANSDAIGGGSSSVPAWDKTPANTTSAGRAIYRMPSNDHSRQWYVQLELGWGTNSTNNHQFKITIGTGWDTVDALTGAGSTITYEAGSSSSANVEFLVAASEDGFAFVYASASQAGRWVLVERARDFDGTVGDDLIVMGYAAQITAGYFPDSHAPTYGCVRYRASDGFQYAANRIMLLGPLGGIGAFGGLNNHGTTTSPDGETNVPIGPINASGGVAGLPRLIQAVLGNDAVANTDHPVLIDGGVKLYRAPVTTFGSLGGPVFLVAQE